jgi:hypothetical protein
LVGYNAVGRQVSTRRITGSQRGLYPCTKPKNYGFGVTMCPYDADAGCLRARLPVEHALPTAALSGVTVP